MFGFCPSFVLSMAPTVVLSTPPEKPSPKSTYSALVGTSRPSSASSAGRRRGTGAARRLEGRAARAERILVLSASKRMTGLPRTRAHGGAGQWRRDRSHQRAGTDNRLGEKQ